MKTIKINWSLVDKKINIDILKICQAKTEKHNRQTAAARVLTFGK